MQVITPAGAREKVENAVPVDATRAAFNDPDVAFVTVPGTGESEAALEVKGPNGTTLVLNDMVGNIRNASGFGGWFLRLMRFAGDEPRIPITVKLMMIRDKVALAGQFRRWADLPSLKRILVSHGSTIEANPHSTLRKLAASLG